jgi:CheY-like chemotaxis protein
VRLFVALPAQIPRHRVLVIDDEPLVGRAVKRVLADQDVTCVTSGREALQLLREGPRFGVLLCDLMMPDMTGAEFRKAMMTVRPDLEQSIIFITGGAFTPDMERFLEESGCPHLLKPFDVPALRGIVAARLGAS